MITFKKSICIFLLFLLLQPAVTFSTVNSTFSSLPNTTSSEPDIYILSSCYGQASKICRCYRENLFCTSSLNPLKSANIKFTSQLYKFLAADMLVETDVLKKDKILPENEHTIESLAFDFSKIGRIEDGAFDKFVKLQGLSLKYCNLSSISNQILTQKIGKTLNSLDLNDNNFVKLESNVFKYLTNLTSLDLSGNKIEESLCKELFPASLNVLKIKECEISYLKDDVFLNLKNLTILDLSGNPLTFMPKAFNSLTNLNHLKLSSTKITILAPSELKIMQNLNKLDLSNTATLKYIDTFAFCSFPNLTELDLSYNRKLDNIHENAFGSFIGNFVVTKLEDLKINNCNLTFLPENLLQWEKIKHININENPFVCNCSMAWLIDDFVNPTPKYYKSFRGALPSCHGPNEVNGKTFQEVSGIICSESNKIIDNRIVVCDEKDDLDSPCKCDNHELICRAWDIDYPFLSLNLKTKNPSYVIKSITFAYYPIPVLRKGQVMPGSEHTIEEINLESNKLKTIENGTFDAFTSLKKLKIRNSYLTTIDEGVLTESLGKTLIELNLDNNFENISSKAFQHLTILEKLVLSLSYRFDGKKLNGLFSKSLKNLKKLKLEVSMKELDENLFDDLVNLEELDLSKSDLTSLPAAINSLTNLQILDLSRTRISNFNLQNFTTVFDKMKTLRMRSMSGLGKIDDCGFCSFPNLEDIDLAGCSSLEFIHENAFGNAETASSNETKVSKIKYFDCLGCKLSTLSEKLLPWDTLKVISINRNPFNCDCSMAWLINDSAKKCPKFVKNPLTIFHTVYLKCAGPGGLKGKHFDEISTKNCSTNYTTYANFEEDKDCTVEIEKSNIPLAQSDSRSELSIVLTIIAFVAGILGAIIFGIFYKKRTISTNILQGEIEKLNENLAI